MGGTFDSMCSCDNKNLSVMKNSEISREFPKDINSTNQFKSPSRNREYKNSIQFGKITQFITPSKIDEIEEENFLLNTAKNTIPSNNALSHRSNGLNNSEFIDIPLEPIQIENNNYSDIIQDDQKGEIIFGQVSKIEENEIDKKNLFNRKSKNSLNELIQVFNKEIKANKNMDNNNKDKSLIINYDGEQCLFNGDLDNKYQLNGEGCLKFKNGKTIEGNFINGKLNGFGKYTDENGNYYEGEFNNGELNGNGKIITIKENNNNKSMNSTKKILNKVIYNGNIKNFKKEGLGKEACSDYIYEGNFKNDMKNGKGKIKFINTGDFYEGEFTNDKITGFGKYIWANKHQYIGDFIDGEMNGKGKYKWPDGSEYEGEYVNNKREGKGKFKWSNGAIFEGIFHNGKPKGKGKMTYKGSSVNSEFKNGHLKVAKKELKNLK